VKSAKSKPTTIAEYISGFPPDIQKILKKVRATVKRAAPRATEAIKYQLPTFVLNGNLVHFGAFRSHIGFYALPSGHARFRKELSRYRSGKGSVQFPLDHPMPLGLIAEIVKFRVKENLERSRPKRKPAPR
jgi:uncharacterized protein YdhG (YjbR/CyaY superfamily)